MPSPSFRKFSKPPPPALQPSDSNDVYDDINVNNNITTVQQQQRTEDQDSKPSATSPPNQHRNNNNNNNNETQIRGKRTGVTVPPRGEIPLEANGFESVDAFWNAAQSPVLNAQEAARAGRRGVASPVAGRAGGRVGGNSTKEQERQLERQQFEDEAGQNAARRPEILNRLENDQNNNNNNNDDDNNNDGDSRTRQSQFQQTPTISKWSNRILHQAMGIPTGDTRDDDDDNGDLNSSTTSPAYTILSRVSTAPPSTTARHDVRQNQSQVQLDNLVNGGRGESPVVPAAKMVRSPSPSSPGGASVRESEEKGMDPPEELDASSNNSRGRGGMPPDPVEKDVVLEPPEQQEEEVDFDQTQDSTLDSAVDETSQASSRFSGKSGVESQGGRVSERTTPSRALDESMEQVVDTFDNEYNNTNYDDDDKEAGGGMQLATQDGMEEDVQFDAGGGGDHYDDDLDDQDGGLEADAVSQQSSKRSREEGSKKLAKAKYPSEDDDEGSIPEKKKAKKERAPTTPSALRKKGSKKKNPAQRVNWSTPTGRANGIPAANRDYEAVPVSDYKEDYSDGKEPRTPGGTHLRRSRRARFKPLQFWKNEKLIYEAQNEEGLLGEAMGDMPVVTGVMHALPTPYKEKKVRDRPEKAAKRAKKKKSDNDDDSDGERSAAKAPPFDDSKLRKKYHIHNGESGSVWAEATEDTMDSKVVSRLENRSFSKLPLSTTRKKNESKVVGFASQAFHVLTDDDDLFPGYIAGNVVLPPRGIKDAEGVGLCSQVFNVGDCQPNSLEFALADPSSQDGEFDPATAQRYLLSKGDMFHVPPGNVYRIENHSKTEKASLFWTIIKCTSRAEQDSDEE